MTTRNDNWYGRILTPAALLAASAVFVSACSSDKSPGAAVNDAGSDATSAGSGGKSTGTGGAANGSGGKGTGGEGTGGKGTGGTHTGPEAGADSSAPEASTPLDAGPSAAEVLCAGAVGLDADGAAAGKVLLVSGTDYKTKTETAAVDLTRGCVLGRSTVADGDAVPLSTGGRAFVIEHTNGALNLLSATGTVEQRFFLRGEDAATKDLNPHDIVVPANGSKAYVSLFAANSIAIVDLAQGAVTGQIDLTSFLDPTDGDKSVDVDGGIYDAVSGHVFFILDRIDQTLLDANYNVECAKEKSLVIGIDPATDAILDLNGAAPGVGVELALASPSDRVLDAANHRLLILDSGCMQVEGDGGERRVGAGVESVDLRAFATSVLFTPTSQDFFDRLILLSPNSTAIQSFDSNFSELWNLYDPSVSTLGASLSHVPGAAVRETADTLVGVAINNRVEVQRFTVSTGKTHVVTDAPWAGSFANVGGAALVE